jgi:N-methylhydantoinase B/oxoprolinase/acetone carboxylase alpha subunit
MEKGKLQSDILRLILANVRTPEEREGDLLAQVAANNKGIQRLKEVIHKHGLRKVLSYGSFIQDYTEKILRKTLSEIPDGHYTFEDFMDGDGIHPQPVKIRARLSIRKEEAYIDFSGSSSQVEGGINANFAVTLSAVLYVFRSLISQDIPFNTGLFRPLTIEAPEGSVVSALSPAATAGGNVETSQRIVDVLLGCLAQAIPERIPAASSGTMNNVAFGGRDPLKNEPFAYYETIGGGMGASATRPGLDGVHTHMTNSLNTPIEALENYLPVLIRRYTLRKRSGGRGRFKGGNGIIREYEFTVPTQITIMSERRRFSPYGLLGGQQGKKGHNVLIRKKERIQLGSKSNLKAKPGDRLLIETPGGGGYGQKK